MVHEKKTIGGGWKGGSHRDTVSLCLLCCGTDRLDKPSEDYLLQFREGRRLHLGVRDALRFILLRGVRGPVLGTTYREYPGRNSTEAAMPSISAYPNILQPLYSTVLQKSQLMMAGSAWHCPSTRRRRRTSYALNPHNCCRSLAALTCFSWAQAWKGMMRWASHVVLR